MFGPEDVGEPQPSYEEAVKRGRIAEESPGALQNASWEIARIAHWLLNDTGFTRKKAARDLALLAKKLDPDIPRDFLGDAAQFVYPPPTPAARS
jgi:hypothetical protein